MEQKRVKSAKQRLLKALVKTLGIVTDACKLAKVERTTYYKYLKADPEFAKEVESIEDVALDFAESALHNNIEKGKEASIIFYLKTKGKKRGYIERQEITGADNNEMTIKVIHDGGS